MLLIQFNPVKKKFKEKVEDISREENNLNILFTKTFFLKRLSEVQPNFSGSCENVSTLWPLLAT